ncbi:MAG: hypothetical protein IT204_22315 [Fimbriimonadaceae bacterium]|nr:hypothetical protein [Fimbriimonadaceae bacterium]
MRMETPGPADGDEDAALLQQFEKLLASVAKEVGTRSVQPHTAELREALDGAQKAVGEQTKEFQRAASVATQRVQGLRDELTTLLSGYRDKLTKLLEDQRAAVTGALEGALQQARRREAAAAEVSRGIEHQLQAAAAASHEEFGRTADQLQAHLERYADQVLGAVAAESAAVERLQTLHASIDSHTATLQSLGQELVRTAEPLQALPAAVTRSSDQLTARLAEFDRQIQRHLGQVDERLAGLDQQVARLAADQRSLSQHLNGALHDLRQDQTRQASASEGRLAAIETRLAEMLEFLQRPKGLAAWFGRTDGQ